VDALSGAVRPLDRAGASRDPRSSSRRD